MYRQCLNISQMKHLKDLGVDTSKASMVLLWKDDEGNEMDWDDVQDELSHPEPMEMFKELYDAETGNYDHSYRKYCGVFTLQDILGLLPSTIKVETNDEINEYWLELGVSERDKSYWFVQYRSIEDSIYVIRGNESLIDAAYEMLCWCLENGYIKTNKEE